MLEFRYDTQLLIEGKNLDEDVINDYITEHFKGDCLFISILTNRGKCWNIVHHLVKSMISLLRIWNVSQEG